MTPDPVALQRVRVAIVVVLSPLVLSATAAAFFGVWPYDPAVDVLQRTFGFATLRGVFTTVFVGEGLILLAVLVPLALAVNAVRWLRGR